MIQAVIQKWGNSQAIRIPKAIMSAANMCENESVLLDVAENQIILRKLPSRKTLDDLFAGYTGDYRPVEWETGADVGLEALD